MDLKLGRVARHRRRAWASAGRGRGRGVRRGHPGALGRYLPRTPYRHHRHHRGAAAGGRCHSARATSRPRWTRQRRRTGRRHILVNGARAGGLVRGNHQAPTRGHAAGHDIKVVGYVHAAPRRRPASPAQRLGRIVNIGRPHRTRQQAARGCATAICHMTKDPVGPARPQRITVNVIPGVVDTPPHHNSRTRAASYGA